MERRDVLKTIGLTAVGAGLAAAGRGAESNAEKRLAPAGQKRKGGQFVEAADGTNLFFREWGTGRPVLFVAPWALNSDWWEYQMTDLAERGLRCVAYDRRGHGRSQEPPNGYEFDTLADDLAAVIEQLELRDVVLVGQSLGCAEIVRYLTRHGVGRVARVALVSTITPFILKTEDNPDGVDRAALEAVRETLRRDRPHPIAAAAPAFFGAPKNNVSAEVMDWWVRMMVDRCSLRVMVELQKMFTETDFRGELQKVSVPTLLIHGDIDTSAPLETTGSKTAKLIPGSQLRVYEGAAHGLPFTHAERLNADLLAFVKA